MKNSSKIWLFKYIQINIQLIFREKIDFKKVRNENIKNLFKNSIFPEGYIRCKYDMLYETLKDHTETFNILQKILEKEEKEIEIISLIKIENDISLPNKI